MSPTVRELPPLRLHLTAETPSGRKYRWGGDERRPENVPTGTRFSSTAPGGHERLDTTLARKPGVDYGDLERLTTLRTVGAGGAVAWEGRLERAPRTSGDQMAVTPSAVGWQAHLDDDKSIREVYVGADLRDWGQPPLPRLINLNAGSYSLQGAGDVVADTSATPVLRQTVTGDWAAASRAFTEAYYDTGAGASIGKILYAWSRGTNVNAANASWTWSVLASTDQTQTSVDQTGNLRAAGPGSGTLTTTTATRRYGIVQLYFTTGPDGAAATQYTMDWTKLIVIGDHGLPITSDGIYASDVVADAVSRGAPLLTYTTGAAGTIQPSSFVIPHIAFKDPTTASEIVKEATRYGLQDWFVWDGPTFWWHDRGAYGRSWRARVGPAQLEETGPAVDRIWESVIVQYQDVDGSTRTVGPPGSGADTEDSTLKDSDPDNPANQLGIIRRDLLQMGVGTAASATELGRRFLEETKQLDSSGRARIVGHVQDDRGVLHPYWRVRAGDTITFVDSNDTSARRIVRAEHDVDSMTCSIDLDAPPDALPALLARLGVVLIPLGL